MFFLTLTLPFHGDTGSAAPLPRFPPPLAERSAPTHVAHVAVEEIEVAEGSIENSENHTVVTENIRKPNVLVTGSFGQSVCCHAMFVPFFADCADLGQVL